MAAHLLRTCTALIAAVAVTACNSASRGAAATSPRPATSEQADPVSVAKAQADSARYPWTDDDAHFMSVMIAHHAQAIVMSSMAASHGANASVRTLAERIINAQEDEIASAQQWLRDRRLPVPDPRETGMRMNHAAHEMPMSGMLTESQMKQLDAARGQEFDRRFLTFMIQHHRGAMAMVQRLFGSHGAGQDQAVFKFASDVEADQGTEIARMERMLAALTP